MSGAADENGGGGGPGAPELHDDGLLPELVARLRGAGLDPDVEQLCDALWLARWTRGASAPDEEGTGQGPARRPGHRPAEERP
ncbi:hypothetical protein, partial [Streptomyces sp. SID7909]|uniref:hypothetical protein n=1 Tax=Streptomyces sp. SID7909 TaxID=2706092 RepID=UPI0013BA36BE